MKQLRGHKWTQNFKPLELGGDFDDQMAWPAWLKIPGDAVWSSKCPPNMNFRERKNQPNFDFQALELFPGLRLKDFEYRKNVAWSILYNPAVISLGTQ